MTVLESRRDTSLATLKTIQDVAVASSSRRQLRGANLAGGGLHDAERRLGCPHALCSPWVIDRETGGDKEPQSNRFSYLTI